MLDVGASTGYGLRRFLMGGFRVNQLHGIELLPERVEAGRKQGLGIDLIQGDATKMPYSNREFAVVCEQFCFCHVPNIEAKMAMAREMSRVADRFILIHDWRAGSASRSIYAVSKSHIRAWFPAWRIAARFRSQLWPPLGRPLSRYAPPLYGLATAINPLVGSWMTVLVRN